MASTAERTAKTAVECDIHEQGAVEETAPAPEREGMQELAVHPAAEVFPLLTPDAYAAFKADIAANGLLEAIWLCEGRILDGRNRYRACRELGLQPQFRTYLGETPVAFAWSLNGERRHLSNAQRSAIGVEMLPALEEETKKRQLAGLRRGLTIPVPALVGERPDRKQREAVHFASAIVGASATNIRYAKVVKLADPATFAKLKSGETNVWSAYQQARTKGLPPAPGQRLPKLVRLAAIRRLAAEGNRITQIAEAVGLSTQRVSELASRNGIVLPDAALGRVHRLDARRVIEQTVSTLEGVALGLKAIEGHTVPLAPHEVNEWGRSIRASLRTIGRLRTLLKGTES